MPNAVYSEFLAFAHEMADAAAAISLPLFRQPVTIDNKLTSGFDPVTQADRDSELAMRQMIEAKFPSHAILGEEWGAKAGDDFQWVLDPIDGTRAFISGVPTWGALIALNEKGVPKVGMMDQPFTGERYYAMNGGGAFLRHHQDLYKLSTRACPTLSQATITTTSVDHLAGAALSKWPKIAAEAKLARYGGDCYGYAMVAAGHIDAAIESGLQAYDIQALIPIVEEAGGIVSNWQGGDVANGGDVLACGDRALHAEILAHLA